jgi:hypothetical protein
LNLVFEFQIKLMSLLHINAGAMAVIVLLPTLSRPLP